MYWQFDNRKPHNGNLLSEVKPVDQVPIPVYILAPEIVQHSPALPHQLQKPVSGMIVLFMLLKVLGEVADPVSQQGDLNFRRSGVVLVLFEIFDDFLFVFYC